MRDSTALVAVALLVALAGCGGLGGELSGPVGAPSPSIDTVDAPESLGHDDRATVAATARWEGLADEGADSADGSGDAAGGGRSNATLDPVRVTVRVGDATLLSGNRSVPANGTMTVRTEVDAAALDPGEHEIRVTVGEATATRTLAVEEARAATFAVSAIDAPESVDYGEDLAVTATVTNTGDLAGEQTVRIRYGTGTSANRTVALDGGAEAAVAVTFADVRFDGGDYPVVVMTANRTRERPVSVVHPSAYGKTTLALYVDDEAVDRNVSGVVAAATGYWERNDERYLGYPVAYERVDDADRADIVLRFDRVERCGVEGNDTRYFGCADLLVDEPRTPMTATVDPRISDAEMNATIIHELGHVQGLEPGEEPAGLMNATSTLATHRPVKVHLRADDGAVIGPVEDEVTAALDYFAAREDVAGSDGFAWEFVDSAREAHVQITYDERGEVCFVDDGGSCTVDGEYYGQQDVRLEELDEDVVAWHVGASLAPVLLKEVPPELTGESERRGREDWPE
ncbi:Matrixin [Halorubrum californiense DSM 19288]|uniref:Matrixin n=1 Tax=Halorubrum californiense DSM 19288 TaxID=1227465 RepID=M0ENR6_9EURY|nr:MULTISPECIES: Matrixin [Halorubrum]ELZ48542.1 Matrixin [Halorubrum californiense DSM 19288]TKX69482.1 Ig-like domain repeat protein [Halorubrum sp. GN11GM_10-3_MGM]